MLAKSSLSLPIATAIIRFKPYFGWGKGAGGSRNLRTRRASSRLPGTGRPSLLQKLAINLEKGEKSGKLMNTIRNYAKTRNARK